MFGQNELYRWAIISVIAAIVGHFWLKAFLDDVRVPKPVRDAIGAALVAGFFVWGAYTMHALNLHRGDDLYENKDISPM